MKTIKRFDNAALAVLRKSLGIALDKVGAKHGINLKVGNISYQEMFCKIKVDANIEGAPPKTENDYDLYRKMHGLPKLGTTVSFNDKKYKIAGFKASARKNPVIVERHGKRFVMSVEMVKQLVKMNK